MRAEQRQGVRGLMDWRRVSALDVADEIDKVVLCEWRAVLRWEDKRGVRRAISRRDPRIEGRFAQSPLLKTGNTLCPTVPAIATPTAKGSSSPLDPTVTSLNGPADAEESALPLSPAVGAASTASTRATAAAAVAASAERRTTLPFPPWRSRT